MSLDRIRLAKRRTIGTNQTIKVLMQANAHARVKQVFVAKDAERRVVNPIVALADEKGVPIEWVETMKQLGKACGIEVGAATAAVLEE